MQVRFDIKYERSKKKIVKRIDIQKILQTETLFKTDPSHPKLEMKSIVCRRDKNKKSIRVIGNDGFRILVSIRDEIAYFQDIMDHDKYDRMTRDC
jgi:hypothetical protein